MEKRTVIAAVLFILLLSVLLVGGQESGKTTQRVKAVPHEAEWGIYKLDIATQETTLIYSFPAGSFPSGLRLNNSGDKFVFAQKASSQGDETTEIYAIGIDGRNLAKLTDNGYLDIYPAWSPDDTRIAFLSRRDKDLDIYVMAADGKNSQKL